MNTKLKYLKRGLLQYGANESSDSDNPDDPRFIRITDITGNGKLKDDTFRSLPLEKAKDYLLEDGDILLARSGATVGKSFLFTREIGAACYAGYLIRFKPNIMKLIPKYLYYFTQSKSYWDSINIDTIQATIQNFSAEKYAQIPIDIPDISMQKTIVNFLDSHTAEVDGLISKKQKLIELLQEKRQAIISEAVTKGLNPNVPMKDSGIEWLGNVPAHWKLQKFKNIVSMVGGGTPSKDNLGYWNGEIPWVSPKDMKIDYIDSSEDCITHLGLMNSSTTLIDKPSVLIVVRSGILKHTLPVAMNIVPVSLNQDMKALLPKKIIDVNFLFWMLKGIGSYILFSCKKIGATVDSIETEDLNKLMIPVPPLKEQLVIIEKIKAKAEKIDLLVNRIKEQIEKLKEYRQTLINEAVTGKINVRNYGEETQE